MTSAHQDHESPYPSSDAARMARNEERIIALANLVHEIDRRTDLRFDLNDKALAAALLAAKEAVAAALIAAKEAVDKAEAAAGKRFEATNEFRGQLADQASTFMRQDVAAPQFDAVNRELNALRNQLTTMTGHDVGAAERDAIGRASSALRIAIASVAVSVGGLVVLLVTSLPR